MIKSFAISAVNPVQIFSAFTFLSVLQLKTVPCGLLPAETTAPAKRDGDCGEALTFAHPTSSFGKQMPGISFLSETKQSHKIDF